MKYDKKLIVDRIEARIRELKAQEDATYQTAMERYVSVNKQIDEARHNVRGFVDHMAAELPNPTLQDGEDKIFARLADHLKVYQQMYSTSSWDEDVTGVKVMFSRAIKKRPQKPEINTADSDKLQAVLDIFKTGAPPEVGITDLRAFGLVEFIKYR